MPSERKPGSRNRHSVTSQVSIRKHKSASKHHIDSSSGTSARTSRHANLSRSRSSSQTNGSYDRSRRDDRQQPTSDRRSAQKQQEPIPMAETGARFSHVQQQPADATSVGVDTQFNDLSPLPNDCFNEQMPLRMASAGNMQWQYGNAVQQTRHSSVAPAYGYMRHQLATRATTAQRPTDPRVMQQCPQKSEDEWC